MAISTPKARLPIAAVIVAGLLFAGPPAIIASGTADAESHSSLSDDRGYGGGTSRRGDRSASGYHMHLGENGWVTEWDPGKSSFTPADSAGPSGRQNGGDSGWYVCRRQASWCPGGR